MRRAVTFGFCLVLASGMPASGSRAQDPPAFPSRHAERSASPSVRAQAPTAGRQAPGDFAEPTWSLVRTRRGPAAREDHTWTVDDAGRFAYLFGGRDGGQVFDDLWRFDLASDTWVQLSPRGRGPAARFGHSAVWTGGHGLVVFAGQRGADFFGDLWVYDPGEDGWTELPARGDAPRARYGSCMIVGRDGRLWISHGFTFLGRFDDTRAYDLGRRRWASVIHHDRRPGRRCLHECFAGADGQLVLYGGQDDDDRALRDLWVKSDRGSWRRRPGPGAPARRLYAVTLAGDSAWIFGGAGEDDRRLDDLWHVDRETLLFQHVRVTGDAPSSRSASTLITDAIRGRLLLFGGQGVAPRSDLWQLTEKASSEEE
jgi:hypothetical protein